MAAGVTDVATDYAERVALGKEDACKYHRLACERHLRDLEKGEFVWDWDAGAHAVEFIQILRHHKGREFAGRKIVLEPWQVFCVGSVFAWKKPEDGLRRYNESYTEVPRKNGKTTTAAGVGLYGMTADKEPGADVFSIATARDQAAICFEDAKAMVSRTPGLRDKCNCYQYTITYPPLGNRFQPLSKQTKTLDGKNPHLAIGDEVHAWTDRKTYDQMDDAFGARSQPLFYLITTAGENIDGLCYDLRRHLIAVLEGNADGSYIDDRFFGSIFTLDEGDDWRDERNWKKANPNLGVSKSLDYLRRQVQKAQQIPSKKNAVLNKQFNIWTTGGEAWLDMEAWAECGQAIDLDALRSMPCHLGLDLSTSQDITAAVLAWPPNAVYPEQYTFVPRLYLPEDILHDKVRQDRAPYDVWKSQGHLLVTPGNTIDLRFIRDDILRLNEDFKIVSAGFDPWKAVEISRDLMEEGMDMVEVRQTVANLGAPSLRFEEIVLGRRIRHAGHPVLRWMASNTTVIRDSNGNIRPDKRSPNKRIDGIVAAIMALARIMAKEEKKDSIYSKRGAVEG